MAFNEKGEIIRKSGSQRQTQTEYQKPYPSKLAYYFFEKLAVIAAAGYVILGFMFSFFLLVSFSNLNLGSFFEITVDINDGSILSTIITAIIIAFLLVMLFITFNFGRLLLDFLDKQSFGVIFMVLRTQPGKAALILRKKYSWSRKP